MTGTRAVITNTWAPFTPRSEGMQRLGLFLASPVYSSSYLCHRYKILLISSNSYDSVQLLIRNQHCGSAFDIVWIRIHDAHQLRMNPDPQGIKGQIIFLMRREVKFINKNI